jgi:hypothetical protein
MHIEILSKQQLELLPVISSFKRSFYLVGGTAIALYIGHRQSIDFDLFTFSKLNKMRIRQKFSQLPFQQKLLFEDIDQLHVNMNAVKVTFFQYPYLVEHSEKWDNIMTLPTLLSLAAMKAFALGRRAKWKDYLDLYFILKDFYSITEITIEAERIFKTQFSEKLFREQLTYHADINYSEAVEFLPGFKVDQEEVKRFLIDKALI